MLSFEELAVSRRMWIDDVLVSWCRQAGSKDLIVAELDWVNLAGQVDPKATLWTWAWSRFPVLVHDGLPGLNETNEVRLTLKSGGTVTGFPDNAETRGSRLVLLTKTESGNFAHYDPISIDNVLSAELADEELAATLIPLAERPLTMLPQFGDPDERI